MTSCPLTLPSAPSGYRIYAVGDIHGKFELFQQMMALIEADASKHDDYVRIVFLGDYVDRGEDSKSVIEGLIELRDMGLDMVCLQGNHEWAVMEFMRAPNDMAGWLMWGGEATLKSYGVPFTDARGNVLSRTELAEQLSAKMPQSHHDFLASLPLYFEDGDYLFVHAGVRPDVPIEEQMADDLMRIRGEFFEATPTIDKTVVFGHTKFEQPFEEVGRIGVDTGAYKTGVLSCVVLHGTERYFLSTNGE